MAKFCNKECKEVGPICDFCRFYNFNADKYGVYLNKGYCTKLEKRKEPEDGCKHFICFHYKLIKSALAREMRISDAYSNWYKRNWKKL